MRSVKYDSHKNKLIASFKIHVAYYIHQLVKYCVLSKIQNVVSKISNGLSSLFSCALYSKKETFFVYIRKKRHISDVQCSHVYLFCTGYRKTRFQQEKQLKTKLNENSIITPIYNVTILDFLKQNFKQEQNTFT